MDEAAIAANIGLPVSESAGNKPQSVLESLGVTEADNDFEDEDTEDGEDQDGEEGEGGEGQPAPQGKPAAQTPEAVDIETLRQQAAEAANIKDMVQNNAPLLAQILLSRMTEEQRNAALAGAGLNVQADSQPVENPLQKAFREAGVDDDELSPAEHFVVQNYEALASVGERYEQLVGVFDQEIDTIYAYREFDDAVRNEFFSVIGEALAGKALPTPKWEAFAAARKAGKDVQAAVAETFGKELRTALADAKPKEPKQKPRTPNGDGGGSPQVPGADADLWELIQFQAQTGTKSRF